MKGFCKCCGSEFEIGRGRKYCSEICRLKMGRINSAEKNRRRREARKHERERPAVSKGLTVKDVMDWIQRHYEETGVLLSYGKAVAKMEQQKVRKTA